MLYTLCTLYRSTETVPALVATIRQLKPKYCFFSWERRPLHDDCAELFLSLLHQEKGYDVHVSTIVAKGEEDDLKGDIKGEIFLARITTTTSVPNHCT